MKKLNLIFFSLLLGVIANSQSALGSTKMNLNDSEIGISIEENRELLTNSPILMATTETSEGTRLYLCHKLRDEICLAARYIESISFLPPCDSDSSINCIESVFATSSSGQKIEAQFLKYVNDGSEFEYPAEPDINLPLGRAQGSLWTFPGLKNGAGNENYYVGTQLRSGISVDSVNKKLIGKFSPIDIVAGISPVSLKTGAFGVNKPTDSTHPSNDGSPNGGVGSGNSSQDQSWTKCVVTETGNCYMAEDFPKEYRFGLKLRFGARLQGWYHGRIYQPTISVVNGASYSQTVTVEASPVQVPTIREKVSPSVLPSDLRDFLLNNEVGNGWGYVMPGSSGQDAFMQAKMWIPVIKDKATTSLTYWSVRTLMARNGDILNKCSNGLDSLAGVVTTNALVYDAGPPIYDVATQSLNYKVLSPHFSANGDLARGTYDLILSSRIARCIYGFTNAPIQANISILSEDGSPQVATQVINEKDGWLTLSAAGFTYSSPTIRVQLSQATPSATPSPTQAKKVTIKCAKGKTIKRVSGSAPRCPNGFKRVQ